MEDLPVNGVWLVEVAYAQSRGGWELLLLAGVFATRKDAHRMIAQYPQSSLPRHDRALKYRAARFIPAPPKKRKARR